MHERLRGRSSLVEATRGSTGFLLRWCPQFCHQEESFAECNCMLFKKTMFKGRGRASYSLLPLQFLSRWSLYAEALLNQNVKRPATAIQSHHNFWTIIWNFHTCLAK
ncbi:hypothetical protein K1719_041667 [Acacia pycnantha]|nr:hypothetical protein K1719_041667 [Acacia pycnantha]